MLDSMIPWVTAFGLGNFTGAAATYFLRENKRRIETDKATYCRRTSVLISINLAAFIRSDRCLDKERTELAELIQNLGAGEHRKDFLDSKVERAWSHFLSKSAECGWKRLSGVITEPEISEYNRAREKWERAARKSFGPLPEIEERPSLRNGVLLRGSPGPGEPATPSQQETRQA
jgi:hypothetical protein